MTILGAENYSKMTILGAKFVAFIKEQKISNFLTIFGAEIRQNGDFRSHFMAPLRSKNWQC